MVKIFLPNPTSLPLCSFFKKIFQPQFLAANVFVKCFQMGFSAEVFWLRTFLKSNTEYSDFRPNVLVANVLEMYSKVCRQSFRNMFQTSCPIYLKSL